MPSSTIYSILNNMFRVSETSPNKSINSKLFQLLTNKVKYVICIHILIHNTVCKFNVICFWNLPDISPRNKLTKSNLAPSEPLSRHSDFVVLHLPLFCNFWEKVSYPDFLVCSCPRQPYIQFWNHKDFVKFPEIHPTSQ